MMQRCPFELKLQLSGVEVKVQGWKGLATLAAIGLVAAAVAQELSHPPSERAWHGSVFGFVPYDFRPPTVERIKGAFWNAEQDQIFSPRVFGVGWDVNLHAVVKKLGLAA